MLRTGRRQRYMPLCWTLRLTYAKAIVKQLIQALRVNDVLSLKSFSNTLVTITISYYGWRLGKFIGANARTPELASVFADLRVLQGSFYPKELRLYAWILLWASLLTALYSVFVICRTLLADQTTTTCGVSLKLPITNVKISPLMSNWPASPTTTNAVRRGASLSRLRRAIALFVFALSFIKTQHVGTTLIFHPVSSPLLARHSVASSLSDADASAPENNEEPVPAVPSTLPGYGNPRKALPVVPIIVHFVFGMSEDFGGKPFAYPQYLAIYSALLETKPATVMFWYNYPPSTNETQNWWFERIRQDARGLHIDFILKKARNFDTIYDNPIEKFAHKADIIRLEALLEYGGIYLDLDVYTIRSYESLMHFDTVLGLEGGVSGVPRQGLCNGIIVAAPNSTFIRRWHESYSSFRSSRWAEHSVKLPLQLAKQHPREIVVLDPFALFYPLWNPEGLQMVHSRLAELGGDSWDFDDSQQLAYHAWSTYAGTKWLSRITPDRIFDVQTSFNLLVRRWTTEQLRKDWREAKMAGLVD